MDLSEIPENVLSLMRKGICPVCKKPMMRNGKRTHNKTMSLVCEEKLRETLKVRRTTFSHDGQLYEVNAHFTSKKEK